MPVTETAGARLRSHREAHRLSQEQLAAKLNVQQATVARWESDSRTPSLEMRQRIVAALGIDPIWNGAD